MRDHIITLQDGRKLAYIEYGETNGLPVMLFHGTADTLSSVEEIKKVASATPYVTTHYMKDAGHFLPDDPKIWESILQTIMHDADGANKSTILSHTSI
ncbi:TPA: hypothetical protein ROX88_000408 [Bacillus pseudomycoides]|nr:hypothetical protein [Bacillus pseudomycoides]